MILASDNTQTCLSPYTVNGTSLTQPIIDDLKQQFEINLREIRQHYISFYTNLRNSILARTDVSVSEFRDFLLNLSAFEDEEDERQQKLLSKVKEKLEKAVSIEDIFSFISREWASFINIDIFQSIMKHYKIPTDCESLKYSEHLQEYLQKHRISDFAKINPGLEKTTTTGSEELVLKVNINRLDKISRVIDLKRIVADILHLKTSALRLMDIREGCVVVTFLVPGFVPDALFGNGKQLTETQLERFRALSIQWLKCGKYMLGQEGGTVISEQYEVEMVH